MASPTQERDQHISDRIDGGVHRTDWLVVALPSTLSLRVFDPKISAGVLAVLVVLAVVRRSDTRFHTQQGPLLLLFASWIIVVTRPQSWSGPTVFVLLGILFYRLLTTVDARRIISSTIDGWGLYLVLNVLSDATGIRPSTMGAVANLRESTGFVRTSFPLAGGLNNPPIMAGAYLVAMIFLVREPGLTRRMLRLLCSAAAIFVLVSVASRTALGVTAAMVFVALLLPATSRWIGQFSAIFASVSAFVLPTIFSTVDIGTRALSALAPGRDTTETGVVSLQGRGQIWENVIRFWSDKVTDVSDQMLGFGQAGQYQSGVSLTYVNIVRGTQSHPEFATVHNSFLQQLIDGGVLGFALFFLSVYWTAHRLARRRVEWGRWALAAIFALTTALLGSVTEAQMAPGLAAESFSLLLALVAASCQSPNVAPAVNPLAHPAAPLD